MKQELKKVLELQRSEGFFFIPRLIYRFLQYVWLRYMVRQRFSKRQIHGSTMRLDLYDPGISRALFFIGDREREHKYLLERTLQGKETVLDLGANIGYYVLLEEKLLKKGGRIIGIEPHPKNFALLTSNVKLNKLSNVTLIEGAVAERDGQAPLYLSRLSNVHSMIHANTSSDTGKQLEVKTYSLPTLVKTYGPIDFIRMDIEGYEQQILRSVISLAQREQFEPTILFEVHAKKVNRQEFTETLQQLQTLGYSCRYLATSSLDSLRKHNLKPIASIPTDGRVRHIAEKISFSAFQELIWSSRCVVLERTSR